MEIEAAFSNPVVGSNYVTLGCYECPFVKAISSCPEKYHLCSFAELYSGAYLIARKNGWFKFNTEVWGRETTTSIENMKDNEILGDLNVTKMAICCSDE